MGQVKFITLTICTDGCLFPSILPFHIVHPGTGTFAFTRMIVGIKYGYKFAVGIGYIVSFPLGIVHLDARIFCKLDRKVCGKPENALFYFFEFKVRFGHFVVQFIFFGFQFFRNNTTSHRVEL